MQTDALLLREPVAFAPQPYALPGSGPGPGAGGGVSATELVAFVVSLRTQVRVRPPPRVSTCNIPPTPCRAVARLRIPILLRARL